MDCCCLPDCTEPAVFLVRADSWTDDGIMMLVVMRSSWERFGPNPDGRGLYCEPHAREHLAGLPLVVQPTERNMGAGAEIFTHG